MRFDYILPTNTQKGEKAIVTKNSDGTYRVIAFDGEKTVTHESLTRQQAQQIPGVSPVYLDSLG